MFKYYLGSDIEQIIENFKEFYLEKDEFVYILEKNPQSLIIV